MTKPDMPWPPLSHEQRQQLDRCHNDLGPLIKDRLALLEDFLDRLQLPESTSVGREPVHFLAAVSEWLDAQSVQFEDIGFLNLRLAFLIGQIVMMEFDGSWFLDDNPTSPNFANYVVGRFTRLLNHNAVVNPFVVVREFLRERDGRGPIRTPTRHATSYVEADGHVVRTLAAVVAELEDNLLHA